MIRTSEEDNPPPPNPGILSLWPKGEKPSWLQTQGTNCGMVLQEQQAVSYPQWLSAPKEGEKLLGTAANLPRGKIPSWHQSCPFPESVSKSWPGASPDEPQAAG